MADNFQSVHVRHEQINDQKIELSGLEKLKAFSAIIGENDRMAIALQHNLHGRPNGGIVVDNQNVCHTAPGSAKDQVVLAYSRRPRQASIAIR